jgi:hypothetical protein
MTGSAIVDESETLRNRRLFLSHYFKVEYGKAMQVAREKNLQSTEAMEIELMAECAVFANDPSAEEWIEKCASFHSLTAMALRACLAATRKDGPAAANGLTRTFEECRTNPWLRIAFFKQVLNTSRFVANASKDPKLARQLCDGLSQPFACEVMREDRWVARIEIAKLTESNRFNAQLRDAMEPFANYPMWDQEFLKERLVGYQVWKDPRLPEAAGDLRRFLENRSPEFGATFRKIPHTPVATDDATDVKKVASEPTPSSAPQ